MAVSKPPQSDVPGNQGALRPTIIAPVARKPPSQAAKTAPTVIGPVAGRDRSPPVPRDPPAPERKSVTPTAIPGVAPERISVTLSDLRKLSPGLRPAIADEAMRLVQGVAADRLSDRKVVMWGHALQQDYTALVSQTLDLTQSDVVRNVSAHLGRMIDILGSIDIEAACGTAPAPGLLAGLFKAANGRVDTPAELARARAELDHLVGLMNNAFGALLGFRDMLEQHASRIDAIGDTAEAAALAALYLAENLAPTAPSLAQRFTERAVSLTQTVAQIRSGDTLRRAQIEQPLQLIATIQNVALVTVPGWLGSVAALSGLMDARSQPTPTEARELANQLRAILQKLET